MWTSRLRTLDDWLDIRFLFTRVFVTCLGGLFLVVIAVSSCVWLASVWPKPPPQPPSRQVFADGPEEEAAEIHGCSVELQEPPPLEYAFFLVLAALPLYGMALVWRRPRGGFLMAGSGIALFVAVLRVRILVDWGIEDLQATFGWIQDTIVLSLLLWLAFASWKVGPPGPDEPFRGPLRLDPSDEREAQRRDRPRLFPARSDDRSMGDEAFRRGTAGPDSSSGEAGRR